MKTLTLISLFLLASFTCFSQEYEYGKPEEMKGLTKVYVDTKGNLKDRDRIVEQISEAKIGLTVVEVRDDAEIIIDFETVVSRQAVGKTITNPSDPRFSVNVTSKEKVKIGNGKVTIKGKNSSNPRVVLNFDGGNNNPAAAFAKMFVKAYKKANDPK